MAELRAGSEGSSPSSLGQDIFEIELLLDFISGRSDKHISSLDDCMSEAGTDSPKKLKSNDILSQFFDIRSSIDNKEYTLSSDQSSFIIRLKDALNTLVFPARGLTIAFTMMFSVKYHAYPPHRSSRLLIAQKAFPGFIDEAESFRSRKTLLSYLCLLVTLLGALLLWQAFYGEQLASRFEETRAKYTEASSRVFAAIDASADKNKACYDLSTVCRPDQPNTPCPMDPLHNGQIHTLCEDFRYRQAQLCAIVHDVGKYSESPTYAVARSILPAHDFGARACPASTEKPPAGTEEDVPTLLNVLTLVSNYLLPIMFGFSGSIAAFLRGLQEKVRDSVLSPRDYALMFIRLPLGIIAGIAVGLFYNGTASSTPTTATFGTFTLTAAGIAFLAGYGAEAFFLSLDKLIDKVFSVEKVMPRTDKEKAV